MTERNPDALIVAPVFVKRPPTTFRLREDFTQIVREECIRLGCSKGVYFEVLLSKAWQLGLIGLGDVFAYDSECRRLSAASGVDLDGIAIQGGADNGQAKG